MTKLFYDLRSQCYFFHQLKGAGFCCVAKIQKNSSLFFVFFSKSHKQQRDLGEHLHGNSLYQ